jgi:hypothetical protein
VELYPINILPTQYYKGERIKCVHLFTFKSSKKNYRYRYIIEAEVFDIEFIAIKFYQKNHKLSKKKYQTLTNANEVRNIVNSCLQVIPILLQIYPNHSFGAVGSRAISEDEKFESEKKNQRFVIYRAIMLKKFKEDKRFAFVESEDNSAFAIINLSKLARIEDLEFYVVDKYNEILDCMVEIYNEIHYPE